jgi:hypothetical protein
MGALRMTPWRANDVDWFWRTRGARTVRAGRSRANGGRCHRRRDDFRYDLRCEYDRLRNNAPATTCRIRPGSVGLANRLYPSTSTIQSEGHWWRVSPATVAVASTRFLLL